jgi:hypothetical protein
LRPALLERGDAGYWQVPLASPGAQQRPVDRWHICTKLPPADSELQ